MRLLQERNPAHFWRKPDPEIRSMIRDHGVALQPERASSRVNQTSNQKLAQITYEHLARRAKP
jgi:hypothetical protein